MMKTYAYLFLLLFEFFLSLLKTLMNVTSEEMTVTTYALIQLVPKIVPAEMVITFIKMGELVWVSIDVFRTSQTSKIE